MQVKMLPTGRHRVLALLLQLLVVVTGACMATPPIVEEVAVEAQAAITVPTAQPMVVLEQRTRVRQVEMAVPTAPALPGVSFTGAMVVVEVAVVRQLLVQMVQMVPPVVVVQEVTAGME